MQFPKAKHAAHMCGGMKALKHKRMRTWLRLADPQLWKHVAHMTASWNIRLVKRTHMAAIAKFTIRVFVTLFSLHTIERKGTVARKF